jgi:lipid-A-disaccharide synthase
MTKNIMIIAGEVSGDMHAGRIVAALKAKHTDVTCWGIGGDELRAQGVELLYDVSDMAVMGLTEVLKRYFFFRRVFNHMLREAERRRPDAVLLIDYPGFNLRIAQRLHGMGLKVLYYVCPQVWAWHRSRIPKMAQIVDRLMVIFPFEVEVFRATDLRVDFVGHPLVESARRVKVDPEVELPWTSEERVALLPGSRRHEVQRILPVMLRAAAALRELVPGVCFVIAAPSEKIRDVARETMEQVGMADTMPVVTGQTRQALRQARAAMVASGTATIEAALQTCPMIVVYRTSPLTYMLAKRLVKGVKNIGMVNIVAGRTLCPEFIQQQAEPTAMAQQVRELLGDTEVRRQVLDGLKQVEGLLGEPGGENRVAEIIYEEIKR